MPVARNVWQPIFTFSPASSARRWIKLRKQDKDERDEHETLLDLYMRAMESEERAAKAPKAV